jgi:deuterolysin
MKFFTLAAVASLANAASVDLTKRDSALDVKLEMVGNTAVKAKITNTGADALKVLKTGSFLDKASTEKVAVFQGSKCIERAVVFLWSLTTTQRRRFPSRASSSVS